MADLEPFRFRSAVLRLDDGREAVLSLVAGEDSGDTHFTLFLGPNGTSKSRILAALAEFLTLARINPADHGFGPGIKCLRVELGASQPGLWMNVATAKESSAMPKSILVISNLVRDRFQFSARRDDAARDYYQYLGVRQSTNLTTTGAIDRAVTEAFLSIIGTRARLGRFRAWVEEFFPGASLALALPRGLRADMAKFLGTDPAGRYELVKKQLGKRPSRLTQDLERLQLEKLTASVLQLFEFIDAQQSARSVGESTPKVPDMMLDVSNMGPEALERLAALLPAFYAASSAGFKVWPTLLFDANGWIAFDQLSSGEQNLVSVGAKLIAYAEPSSLILIDEPEVSLNVAWQQRYIDLVERSLADAPGCHVLIATHSPHLVSNISQAAGSLVLLRKIDGQLTFQTRDAIFEAWGAEAILYEALDIPSASSFAFEREVVAVLKHIQDGKRDRAYLQGFLKKADRFKFDDTEPLAEIVKEVRMYSDGVDGDAR